MKRNITVVMILICCSILLFFLFSIGLLEVDSVEPDGASSYVGLYVVIFALAGIGALIDFVAGNRKGR